jgi:hypothetical protein
MVGSYRSRAATVLCDPPGVDREHYRRRQRRRAIIGWSVGGLVVALVALAVILGDGSGHSTAVSSSMTADQYVHLHKGERESLVLKEVGGPGLGESEIDGDSLLGLFPGRPVDSVCSFWALSDAPGHLARLCFGEAEDLLQKSVAAMGDALAPKTLA